jgi:hypothetical protein
MNDQDLKRIPNAAELGATAQSLAGHMGLVIDCTQPTALPRSLRFNPDLLNRSDLLNPDFDVVIVDPIPTSR